MDLLLHLHKDKLDSLGYSTVYLEKPIPDIVKNIDWRKILDKPPDNLSKTTLNELQLLSSLTRNRTPKETELVYSIDTDIDTQFELLCTSYGLKYPKEYIQKFYGIIKPIIHNTKAYYNRPRPAQLAQYFNIKIDTIITQTHHSAAYPSGHTVYSKLISLILQNKYSQIDPYKLDYIVNQTAKARMLQGVHYPSDNEASMVFSTYLFNKLQRVFQ